MWNSSVNKTELSGDYMSSVYEQSQSSEGIWFTIRMSFFP